MFDLVMVAERMEESLVLLKDLLCADWEDVIVLKSNARNNKVRNYVVERVVNPLFCSPTLFVPIYNFPNFTRLNFPVL